MIERLVPKYDRTITLGQVLMAVVFVATTVGAWYEIKSDHALFVYRLDNQDKALTALTGVVHTLTEKSIVDVTQNAKIEGLDSRILRAEEYARDTRARLHTVEDALKIVPPKLNR